VKLEKRLKTFFILLLFSKFYSEVTVEPGRAQNAGLLFAAINSKQGIN
jgi:hypothetical protein